MSLINLNSELLRLCSEFDSIADVIEAMESIETDEIGVDILSFSDLEQRLEDDDRFNIEVIGTRQATRYFENEALFDVNQLLEYSADNRSTNIEYLASLHRSETAREEFYNYKTDLTNLIDEITEIREQIEELEAS